VVSRAGISRRRDRLVVVAALPPSLVPRLGGVQHRRGHQTAVAGELRQHLHEDPPAHLRVHVGPVSVADELDAPAGCHLDELPPLHFGLEERLEHLRAEDGRRVEDLAKALHLVVHHLVIELRVVRDPDGRLPEVGRHHPDHVFERRDGDVRERLLGEAVHLERLLHARVVPAEAIAGVHQRAEPAHLDAALVEDDAQLEDPCRWTEAARLGVPGSDPAFLPRRHALPSFLGSMASFKALSMFCFVALYPDPKSSGAL
jgi:hypothetical protein